MTHLCCHEIGLESCNQHFLKNEIWLTKIENIKDFSLY